MKIKDHKQIVPIIFLLAIFLLPSLFFSIVSPSIKKLESKGYCFERSKPNNKAILNDTFIEEEINDEENFEDFNSKFHFQIVKISSNDFRIVFKNKNHTDCLTYSKYKYSGKKILMFINKWLI